MKEKIFMVAFILILGTILTGLLVGVNYYTEPIIKKNEEIKIKSSVLDVFDIMYTQEDIGRIFSEHIEIIEKDNKVFYSTINKEIAFEYTGPGLWGQIYGIIAVLSDLETIKGITVIHQEETPGLGGRIAEKDFLDKFKNKKVIPGIVIVPFGKAKQEHEIDGITGATMTSKAFEKLLNSQSKRYLALFKEYK